MQIRHITKFYPFANKTAELINFLQELAEAMKAYPGCITYEVLCEIDQNQNIITIGSWNSHLSYKRALEKISGDSISKIMDLMEKSPEIQVYQKC